ncbi:TatD family hydrolase [Pelagibacterales bacterium SAG-MED23]|nr:TatD family hydrolase [Pelagibacterales bacterium SAG-MED23]
MIDSHCHLDHEPLVQNIKDVLSRCKKEGINKVLTISTTLSGFPKILKIVDKDEMIFGTFGIHPHETDTDQLSKDEIIKKIKSNNKIIGVGETGLDFYYNNSDKDKQIESFKNHIDAALDLDIPLIVHSRNAELETYEILKNSHSSLKILMHCFTGSLPFALKLMKLNTYFSASGIITFKNSIDLQNTFKELPLERLLIETDSPFLAPEPMRGKKNEPSFVRYTLKKLSELKDIDTQELDKITTDNFNRLFFNT